MTGRWERRAEMPDALVEAPRLIEGLAELLPSTWIASLNPGPAPTDPRSWLESHNNDGFELTRPTPTQWIAPLNPDPVP